MWTAPMPTYPDIRLAITSLGRVSRIIEEAAPEYIHIATEGPIGWLTRRDCLRRKRVFTTSYHTRFPEYIKARVGVPERLTYAGLRYFHRAVRGGYGEQSTSSATISPGAAFPGCGSGRVA